MKKINLLEITDKNLVRRTEQIRTLSIGGEKKEYPIYQVSLELLYHNDSNYHIATEVNEYENKNSHMSLRKLGRDIGQRETYNEIMGELISQKYKKIEEQFPGIGVCFGSKPEDVQEDDEDENLLSTIENMYTGIVLSDGRILDGNFIYHKLKEMSEEGSMEYDNVDKDRYFLRFLNHIRETNEKPSWHRLTSASINGKIYFNTIILDLDIDKQEKAVKAVELELVHGRLNNYQCEKCEYPRQSCNSCNINYIFSDTDIDKHVGLYRDIIKNKSLTLEEYSQIKGDKEDDEAVSTQAMLDTILLVNEYLEYIRCPENYRLFKGYHKSRSIYEFRVVNRKLKTLTDEEQAKWKKIFFACYLLDIAKSSYERFESYFLGLFMEDDYKLIEDELFEHSRKLEDKLEEVELGDEDDIYYFVRRCGVLKDEIDNTMEKCFKVRRERLLQERLERFKEKISGGDGTIDDLQLSVRAHNCLKRAGIYTIEELKKLDGKDLREIKNLHGNAFREVLGVLELLKML